MSKTVSLDQATGKQMRAFAETHLGMTFQAFEKNDTIRAQIRQAWTKDEIPVGEETAEAAAPRPAAQAMPERDDDSGELIVLIQTTEAVDGDEPVPLGCNGRMIWVPRGEWCAIPMKYRDSLANAVQDRYEPVKEGGMSPPRKVSLYPHQIWTGPGEPVDGVRRPPEKTAAA